MALVIGEREEGDSFESPDKLGATEGDQHMSRFWDFYGSHVNISTAERIDFVRYKGKADCVVRVYHPGKEDDPFRATISKHEAGMLEETLSQFTTDRFIIPAPPGYERLVVFENNGEYVLDSTPVIAFDISGSTIRHTYIAALTPDNTHQSESNDAAIMFPDGRCYVSITGPWFKNKEEYLNYMKDEKSRINNTG
jgi:hypothetical protein